MGKNKKNLMDTINNLPIFKEIKKMFDTDGEKLSAKIDKERKKNLKKTKNSKDEQA